MTKNDLVAKEREIVKVYRYGPNLPHVFTEAKILDNGIAETDMEEALDEVKNMDNTVFIVLTGKDYLLPAVDDAHDIGI